jgi:hypothetical protein
VDVGDLRDDSQAEPGPVVGGRVAGLEDPVAVGLGDARPGVRHEEPVGHPPDANGHAVAPVFDGVTVQILEQLPEATSVRPDGPEKVDPVRAGHVVLRDDTVGLAIGDVP